MRSSYSRVFGKLLIFLCLLCISGVLLVQFTAFHDNIVKAESAAVQSSAGSGYFFNDLLLEEEEDESIHIYKVFTRTEKTFTGGLTIMPHGPEFARDYADYLERDLPPPSLG